MPRRAARPSPTVRCVPAAREIERQPINGGRVRPSVPPSLGMLCKASCLRGLRAADHEYAPTLAPTRRPPVRTTLAASFSEHGIRFFETSAKNGINIEESFCSIASDIKHRVLDGGGDAAAASSLADGARSRRGTIQLGVTSAGKRLGSCC